MDFDEYVVARRGRLVEAAVRLGCPPHRATQVVDHVLSSSRVRRLVRRSADPHQAVVGELAAAVPGARLERVGLDPPSRGPTRQVSACMAVVAVVLAVAALVGPGRQPPLPLTEDQVPPLAGYDRGAARTVLADRGLTVAERPITVCEPAGRVLDTDPPVGTRVARGERVTMVVARPSYALCAAWLPDRVLAWRFVDFATGRGPAPPFAPLVRLVVDRAEPATLTREQAVDRLAWGPNSAVEAVARAAEHVVWTGRAYAVPDMDISGGIPPPASCGVPRPPLSGLRPAVTLTFATPDSDDCPLRIDLYRSSRRIDAVMLYTGRDR